MSPIYFTVWTPQHTLRPAPRPPPLPPPSPSLLPLLQYRTTHNYRSAEFLAPRLADKLMVGLLVMTLYLGIGNNFVASNYINMAAVLFMWITMPAFGAAAYVPTLVLGEGQQQQQQ